MTTFWTRFLVCLVVLMLVYDEASSLSLHASRRQKSKLRQWLKKRQSNEVVDDPLVEALLATDPPEGAAEEDKEEDKEEESTEAPLFVVSPTHNVPTQTCSPELFTCDNGECALMSWKCDGDRDCDDGSDEVGCPPVTCPPGFFKCENNRCIFGGSMCDGGNDCGDGSDEATSLCENFVRTCPPGYYQCESSSRCIREQWICDGDNDCGDYSDERNCNRTCPPNTFQCPNSRCISANYVCDGDNDCGDLADEQGCGTSGPGGATCQPDQFLCRNSGRCIPARYVCDGDNDCGDRSDEQNCGSGGGTVRPPANCPSEFFPLRSGSPSCYHPMTAGLQWQSAADYCRAVHPDAHLLAVETSSELQGLTDLMGHAPPFIAESCPFWWTAGRRVDDSSLQAPYVWRTFGSKCPADGCLDEVTINQWWSGQGALNVPEGQPACIMYRGDQSGLPWTSAPCSAHACTFCEITP
jgi:hypothetical protein